ncbi:MAG: NAD(+) synthase [Clostridia bacterium]|nr:NAD(+) synthase [Clostridia bacterium]
MEYGFVKVAAVSPKLQLADVKFNTMSIEAEIAKQAKEGVEVLVFPELCLCGYTCGDLFLQPFLIEKCKDALREITQFTKGIDMLIFVGLPVLFEGKLYNAAAAVLDGEVLGVVPKSYLPNYAEFFEKRYFASGVEAVSSGSMLSLWEDLFAPFGTGIIFGISGKEHIKIGCEICEDFWVANAPSNQLAAAGATLIVNLSASTELVGKAEYRRTMLKAHTGKNICAYVYANPGEGESTTDCVFAAHNLIGEYGNVIDESQPFSGGIAVAEIDTEFLLAERNKKGFGTQNASVLEVEVRDFLSNAKLNLRKLERLPFVTKEEDSETALCIQAHALARRMSHINAKTAVIGVSGGLDSTLALLATVRAFEILGKDKKDIVAVTMPGFGTTGKTYQNALKMIESVGATLRTVPIKESVLQHFKDIGHDETVRDVTYENAQARMRTLLLMDIANQTNGLVVGTGDLSELALGWCTYSGDQMSMYSLNASIAKTQVKNLVAYEASRAEGQLKETLLSVVNTDISPELLPPDTKGEIAQKTEDLVGPYELHDFYIYHILGRYASPKKVFALAKHAFKEKYDDQTLLKWLKNFYKRFFSQQFKRSCSPDGVKVGEISFSPRSDWHMPSDASASLWMEEVDELLSAAGI